MPKRKARCDDHLESHSGPEPGAPSSAGGSTAALGHAPSAPTTQPLRRSKRLKSTSASLDATSTAVAEGGDVARATTVILGTPVSGQSSARQSLGLLDRSVPPRLDLSNASSSSSDSVLLTPNTTASNPCKGLEWQAGNHSGEVGLSGVRTRQKARTAKQAEDDDWFEILPGPPPSSVTGTLAESTTTGSSQRIIVDLTAKAPEPDHPAEAAQPTKASHPTKATGATPPTQPTELTKPAKATVPVKVTQPNNPAQLSQPTKVTQPIKPIQTTESTNRSEPTKLTGLTHPAHPIGTVKPTGVTELSKPTPSTETFRPANPVQSTKATTTQPAKGTHPTEPIKPTALTRPAESNKLAELAERKAIEPRPRPVAPSPPTPPNGAPLIPATSTFAEPTDAQPPGADLDSRLRWPLDTARLAAKGYRLTTREENLESDRKSLMVEDGDRERLEFHGDRLLDTYVSELLSMTFPRATPGQLDRMLSQFVRNSNLTRMFNRYNLNYRFPGMPPLPLQASDKQRADFVETVIAAYYYSVGCDIVRLNVELLEPLFRRQLRNTRASRKC